MSYSHNKLIELVSLQKFMELDAFVTIIESLYEIDLNHASMRRQAQLRITQLYKQVPVVGATLRFPDKYHVNLSVGGIANSLRELIKIMVTVVDDSVDSFYSKLDEIRGFIYALDPESLVAAGIYFRASFEEKYGFSWNN